MYAVLVVKPAYICENEIKSSVEQITGVLRDEVRNIKGTILVHGVQRVCKGIGKAIKV